jgi:hypothetical protein
MINLPVYPVLAGFMVMGIGAILLPIRVTAQFEIPSLTASGKNEVRAVYGGFGLAMALMLFFALEVSAMRTGILMTVAVALTGMATGRVISTFIDKTIGKIPIFYLLLEVIFSALLYMAI